jgi:hypothetical protein
MAKIDSQWAAQFAVAAELVRRGYSLALYLGNEPVHDALVRGRSSGTQFAIQIKGTVQRPPKGSNARGPDVLVGKLAAGQPTDLFAIVYTPAVTYGVTPQPGMPFRFFVATRQELDAVKSPGKPQQNFTSDWVKYPDIYAFENCWNKLPFP